MAPNTTYYYTLVDAREPLSSLTRQSVSVQAHTPVVPPLNEGLALGAGTLVILAPVPALISSALLTGDAPLRSFFLFLFKPYRRRRRFGFVRNRKTGLPLAGARLGLIPQELGEHVLQAVSDLAGGFDFLVAKPGTFQLGATLPGFASATLPAAQYSSELPDPSVAVEMAGRDEPARARQARRATGWSALARTLERLSLPLFVCGLGLAVYDVVQFPGIITELTMAFYVVVTYAEIVQRLRARLAGNVVSPEGGPVAGAILRLYANEPVPRLVASTTSDGRGLFRLGGRPGDYLLAVEAPASVESTSVVALKRGRQERISCVAEPVTYAPLA